MRDKNPVIMGLIGALLLSTPAVAATADDFTDFPSDWSAPALSQAVENGLLNGYDGKINPTGLLTRAQMATMVNRAFGATATASLSGYEDVAPTDWYYEELAKAVQMGTFQGDNGALRPNQPITREQAFAVLARAFVLEAEDTDALNTFPDKGEVSSWAANAVAALVENGYVTGSNGKLNPKSQITRAEFAQVISNLAGTYVDQSGPAARMVAGNVIVRGDAVSLDHLTVHGDLILADGAANVSLDNVRVTGRIVIRGGGEGVQLTGTSAGSGTVVANPNGTTRLDASACDLGTVTVQSDLSIDGKVDRVLVSESAHITVEKGAAVDAITVEAENTRITGSGKVSSVQANASQVTVSTQGTKVSAADGVTGIKAGDKTVSPGKTETVPSSSGGSGGGSSSGGSSSSGGGSGTTQQDLVVASQTKLVDLGWSQFVAVRFTDGNSLENCTVTVDGTDVTSACTPVTDDGSLVKWEITALNPAKVVISKGSQRQTVALTDNANPTAPAVGEKAETYYFLTNGPVYVWDYHLTNYDAAGQVRVKPGKTTFSLTNQDAGAIAYYSPDAILKKDDSAGNIYNVSGAVELMFNYANGTETEKAWVDGITNVALVAADERNNTLNENLDYTLDKAYPHNGGTVACIQVPLGQSNFFSNGRYQLRVTSQGESKLFPIHVVNETVPSMTLTEASVESGKNVHFQVQDMTYGITMPIYRVDLTDPAGKTTTLTKLDDWYLIGDTFVLYNDKTNHIPTKGTYQLTVYADGFQSFSKKFEVTKGTDPASANLPKGLAIDALSGSTSSGGATSGSGSEGGSNTMNANLVFQADLLINAEIMTELGTGNASAQAIVERWDSMTHDAVYLEGAAQVYTASGYFDAVNTARSSGTYLSFAEYIQEDDAVTTPNRPYAVKQVLEDNLLGEATSFSETASKPVPDLILVQEEGGRYTAVSQVTEGTDPIFLCQDEAYLTALAEQGKLYLNDATYGGAELSKDTYAIDNAAGTITLNQEKLRNKLALGANTLTLSVEGYQTAKLTFSYQKVLEEVALSAPADPIDLGEAVVITCNSNHSGDTCDFFANITSVKLTGPNKQERSVLPEGQEGTGYGYSCNGTKLTLGKNLFTESWANEAGTYTLTLSAAYGYGKQTVTFTMKEKEETPDPGPAEQTPPNTWTGSKDFCGDYSLSCGMGHDDFINAITSVSVNGTPYSNGYVYNNAVYSLAATDGIIKLGNEKMTEDQNTIVISATGYQTLTLILDKNGDLVTGSGTT